MVKLVYGKCDNVEIVFTLNEYTGRRETTVPASEDNTYIFELWAEDEAGNRTYFAAVKVTVDLDLLQFRFSVLEVGAGFTMEEVLELFGASRFKSKACIRDYCSSFWMDEYRAELTQYEVVGG